ncbi:protein FAR1-RELATED SEQUENCE 6-like [Zingiber officinale]|uniref:protein FAR1-RELATED SEQUENCE 6-like n=1 Tax=Zingiber officinale TaxID=94328 RepID=UPI001C4D6CC8|nr:protein FAR1-RELATED SEQUENCE 6-like [Zingiber officinale]
MEHTDAEVLSNDITVEVPVDDGDPEMNGKELEVGEPLKGMGSDCMNDSFENKEVFSVKDNAADNEKMEHNAFDTDTKVVQEDDLTPRLGMTFRTREEVCNFYKAYAMTVGFGVAVQKSSFATSGQCRRVIIACSKVGKGKTDPCYKARQSAKTDCQAKIVAKASGDGMLHLVEVNNEHNHPVNPSTARFLNCYKKMAGSRKQESTGQANVQGSSQSDGIESGDPAKIGRLKLTKGDDEAIYQFFANMQNKDPNFFYLVDLDDHGCLRNLFWADGRSKMSYQYFGDVISIDTTFLTEKYDLPLVLFVGMNHHGQLVLLGCGLISSETIQSYTWLCKAFLTCMLDCCPNAIVTDYSKAIQSAVLDVFPDTRYRWCLSSILSEVPKKLKGLPEYKEIKKALKKSAYDSLKIEDFEKSWMKMIVDNGLESNEWLTLLYENRHNWVPAFLKHTFWAGMSMYQRGETINNYLNGYVYPKTSLKQFFSKYEVILQSKYKKEAEADSESHKTPLLISKFYMEEQISKVYTFNMFRKFQEELKATMYCDVLAIRIDGPVINFQVKECSFIEDGKPTENKDHEVLYNADKLEVQCICGSFEFCGILCRHALSVFKFQQIFEISSPYILSRWKKDYKRLSAFERSRSLNDMQVDNPVARYDYLTMRCLHLAELGFISDDRYQVALKLLKEVEKSLLDDVICRERQPRLLSFETQANGNVQNLLLAQIGTSGVSKNSGSLHVKRRGRPPKKLKESDIETLARPNKEQDFLRSSLIGSEASILQSGATATHLNAQRIDLMEDITTGDLSFGSHFGMHINHEHHIDSQPRTQTHNLLQGQYDPQTIGSQSRMQWIYQQILQDDHAPKVPSGRRAG